MKSVAISHVGKVRDNNEDYYFASDIEDFPLYIVADGIGGRNYGEVASKSSVDYIKDELKAIDKYNSLNDLEEDFVRVLVETNKLIYNMAKSDPKYSGMGTTLSLVYRYEDSLLIGNVGDSRVYAISDSNIRQITVDDTYVNKLIEIGEITEDEASKHPKRNVITNAIGTDQNIEINIVEYKITSDEYVLICSDGLTDMVGDKEIYNIFKSNFTLEDIKTKLLNRALDSGGRDNITFIIIEM